MMANGRLLALDTPARVRQAAGGERLLELECTPVIRAMDVLAGMPGVAESALYGLVFHVTLEETLSPEDLQLGLEAAGVEVGALRPITPTLEDAFIRMMSRAPEGPAPTGELRQLNA